MIYHNYHKHTHYSNIFTPDTHIKIKDYMERMKELGHTTYFTTEHGYGGSIFEAKELCDQYGYKCIFAVEAYIVPDALGKNENGRLDNSNYHIMLIPRTNSCRRKINLILSKANREGYYYKPRISVSDLLDIDPDELFITTACVAGYLRDERGIEEIFIPLYNHFRENLFLEVQCHHQEIQKVINKKALELQKEYGLRLISANDSHYIYPEQGKDRLLFLAGKKMSYDDEDSFILDYPDYDTLLERYRKQNVLTEEQAKEAIANTLLLENCEQIDINRSIKMPTIYPSLIIEQKNDLLYKIIMEKFEKISSQEHMTEEEKQRHIQAINQEFQVIVDTSEINTADYFLLNERIVDLSVNKYHGELTKTGRGSNTSFYINRLLGFTELDRLTADIPLYPERFMSKSRLLETRSLPDWLILTCL